jgi:hypothetical protein
MVNDPKAPPAEIVLNSQPEEIFAPVIVKPAYYDLANDAKSLSDKQIVMLDEHNENKPIADAIKGSNKAFFDYQVWKTDHGFTNKRVSLMNMVLSFLAR